MLIFTSDFVFAKQAQESLSSQHSSYRRHYVTKRMKKDSFFKTNSIIFSGFFPSYKFAHETTEFSRLSKPSNLQTCLIPVRI